MLYPQPEGQLGECMVKHGRDLGDESMCGLALVEAGETYKQLADIKYALEDNVKQNFIEPLQHIQTKDLKEVNVRLQKVSLFGRHEIPRKITLWFLPCCSIIERSCRVDGLITIASDGKRRKVRMKRVQIS